MMYERKYGASVGSLQVKRGSAAGEMTFGGYGSTFGNIDSYGHTIAPGAFRDAVSDTRLGSFPAMLLGHGGWGMGAADLVPVGIWTDVSEDDTGLRLRGRLADTGLGRTLWTLMNMSPHPAITGLSIGYTELASETTNLPRGASKRLTRIKLYEVSLVTFPADSYARVRELRDSGARMDDAFDKLQSGLRTAVELLSQLEKPKPADPCDRLLAAIERLKELAREQIPAGGL